MDDIRTGHVFPPIPDRRFDWCAFHDGHEEETNRYGWGSTKDEAVADLRRLDDELADWQENDCGNDRAA